MKSKIIFILILNLIFSPAQAFAFRVTCSLFPVYEFAREVVKDNAEVNLLLKPGVEPHEFEPAPGDIKILNNSDVFIFTSSNMEHWAEKISSSLSGIKIIEASKGVNVIDNDPHVWLDLNNAQEMVMNIASGLAKTYPEKAEIFNKNAENYCAKLTELDEKFDALNKNNTGSRPPTLVFVGKFAFNYFIKRYKFNYISAYDGENEPSVKRMAEVLKFIKENDVKFIFSDSDINLVAQRIAEETGAEILIFDSCETISDFNKGLSFLEIMQKNYEALLKQVEIRK